jgi:predicted acyltransferase
LKTVTLLLVGGACLGLGVAADYFEVCPIVKIIWTPAWVLYSGGWTFLFLAAFYLLIDMTGFWHWSYPLLVVGANSIVAYCLYQISGIRTFIASSFRTHLGPDFFKLLDDYGGVKWEPLFTGAVVLLTLWLVLFWMYRNKIFVRI